MIVIYIIIYLLGCVMGFIWFRRYMLNSGYWETNGDVILGIIMSLFSWGNLFPALINGVVFSETNKITIWLNKKSNL